jgi:hypothetical protein
MSMLNKPLTDVTVHDHTCRQDAEKNSNENVKKLLIEISVIKRVQRSIIERCPEVRVNNC